MASVGEAELVEALLPCKPSTGLVARAKWKCVSTLAA
jgi:hypothetical protein